MTSELITITVTPIFVKGRNFKFAERDAAETMRTNSLPVQTKAKLELKAGIMAAILMPNAEADAGTAAYISKVLNMAGKDRSDAEADAEVAARKKVSRLCDAYGIKVLEPRGGSKSAAKARKLKAEAKAQTSALPTEKPGVVLAAHVTPTIKKPADWAAHLGFVTKALSVTFKKAEPHLGKAKAAAYRKALAQFTAAIKKINA